MKKNKYTSELTVQFQDSNYSKPIMYSITTYVKLVDTGTENLFLSLDLRDTV